MEQNKEIPKAVVETYAGDMAEVIGNDTKGLVKKIIHGAEEAEKEKNALSPESKQNKIFMNVGIALIFLGIIFFTYFALKHQAGTASVQEQLTPLVFNDKTIYPEVSGLKPEEIKTLVANEINNSELKTSDLEGIYLTENKNIIGLRRFISIINANFTPGENTLFVPDNFLIGGVDKDFFLLIKMREIADIFPLMQKWEGKMFSDLYGFSGIDLSADNNYLLTKNFEDGIVENKNARILKDNEGNIILLYLYPNDNSVIVADSTAAAHEIMLRLASSSAKQ